MADLTRIKNNVAKMVAQNAPESDIDGYIKSEGTTIDAVKAFKLEKPNSFSQTMQNRGADLADVVNRYQTGQQTLPETVFQGVSKGVFGTISDVAGEAIAPVISAVTPDVIKEDFSLAAKQLMETKTAQAIQDKWNGLSERAKANIESAGLLPVGFLAKAGISAAKPLVKGAGSIVNKAAYNVGEKLEKSAIEDAARIAKEKAQKTVLPKETPKVLKEQEARMIPVKEGSNKFEYNPTDTEKEMADILVSVGYKPNEPLKRTRYNVNQANIKEAENLKSALEAKNVVFKKGEINNVLSNVAKTLDDMPSLKTEEGKLTAVAAGFVEKAQKIFDKYPSTPAGILEARKEFDGVFKSEYGKMAFESDKATAAKVAVDTIRQGMNDFIAQKVPDVGVKASLRKQHILYQIEDNLIPKAAATKKTPLGRGLQKITDVAKSREKIIQGGALLAGTTALGAAATFSAPAAAIIGAIGGIKAFEKFVLKNPRLKAFAGRTLKSLGEKGDLSALKPSEIKILQDEVKLLPKPEVSRGAPSAEALKNKADVVQAQEFTRPIRLSGKIDELSVAKEQAIKELMQEKPFMFETNFGKPKTRDAWIEQRARQILHKTKLTERKAKMSAIPSQDKTKLK